MGSGQTHPVASLLANGKLAIGDGYRAKNSELGRSGLPFARAGNINGGFNFAGADCFPEGDLHKAGEKVSREGDVVFTSKGTVGRFAFVRPETPRFVFSPQLCYWRSLDEGAIHPRFLFYWMHGGEFWEQVDAVKGQTDMADYVSLTDQRMMRLTLPSLPEQRAIAEVLGALDDKIELNRQMNHTLEEMAAALFKSWFVDFDPVVAKAEGRAPFGMDAKTAALFPDALLEDDEGELPRGWRRVCLGEITDKIGSGATPRGGSRVYVDTGVSFIRSQNVYDSNFDWSGLARIGPEHAEQLKGVAVEVGDVLINITGASFLRTCVVDRSVLPARVNQHVAIVRAATGIPHRFLHLHLVRPWMKEFLAGHDAGGSRQAITKGHLEGVPIVLPPPKLLAQFEEITGPWFDLRENNQRESRTLAALRDTLLPKLLSGEVRLKQAEKEVEAAL